MLNRQQASQAPLTPLHHVAADLAELSPVARSPIDQHLAAHSAAAKHVTGQHIELRGTQGHTEAFRQQDKCAVPWLQEAHSRSRSILRHLPALSSPPHYCP